MDMAYGRTRLSHDVILTCAIKKLLKFHQTLFLVRGWGLGTRLPLAGLKFVAGDELSGMNMNYSEASNWSRSFTFK